MISHPKKRLCSHLKDSMLIGINVLKQMKLDFECCSKAEIERICGLSLLTHDIGKGTLFFQEYMQDIEAGIEPPRHKEKKEKEHGLLSGVLSFAICRRITGSDTMAFFAYMTVSRHHGALINYADYFKKLKNTERRELLLKQFESIDRVGLQQELDMAGIEFDINGYDAYAFRQELDFMSSRPFNSKVRGVIRNKEIFILINLMFSILIFSDKIEAISQNVKEASNSVEESSHSAHYDLKEHIEEIAQWRELPVSLVDEYKRGLDIKNADMAGWRERICEDATESVSAIDLKKHKILSLNVPTGAGKTLTALKAALKIRERLNNEEAIKARIIYILPYTSIIEQNYEVFEKVLGAHDSRVLLKHHHLAEKCYSLGNTESYEGELGEHLVEAWDSQVVVSTFVQLLHSIFTNRNRQLIKFHSLSNSIIILDEVQSIPFRYWRLIKEIFSDMAKTLNCFFLLMTATMPLIFSGENGEIYELASERELYFNAFNRIDIDVRLLDRAMPLSEFKCRLCMDINKYTKDSFLIVMNTIKSSIQVFRFLKEKFGQEAEVCYLSTNIIPKHRTARINEIKSSSGRKIIVSTQLIEAGVDIDVERVYRDFAPMDCITQTAGRCNREWGGSRGIVTVVKLADEDTACSKEYSAYVYDEVLREATRKVLGGKEIIEERDISRLSELYFRQLKHTGSDDASTFLIEKISGLDYDEAFELKGRKENGYKKDAFQLIDNEFKTIDMFIETDQEAKELWREYEKIRYSSCDGLQRKRDFNKIKKDFYSYVVSIPEKVVKLHYRSVTEMDMLLRVSFEELRNVYDMDTGFLRDGITDYFM